MNTLVWDNNKPIKEHYMDIYKENPYSVIEDTILKVLEDKSAVFPDGLPWSALLIELRRHEELNEYPSIMFRESLWRLMDMGQIELTPERMLKIA